MRKILGGAIAAAAITLGGAGWLSPYGVTHTVDGAPVVDTSEVSLYAAEVEAQEVAARQEAELAYLSSMETDVRNSIQGYFDEDRTAFPIPITVSAVTLIRTSDTTFEGTATMAAGEGSARQIAIHVTADDRNFMWRTDPGALLPLFVN